MSQKPNRNIGRLLASLFWATLLGLLIYVTSLPVLRDEATMVTALGGVHSVKIDDGDAWFGLYGNRARYGIARPDDGVLNMLRASEESGNSVSLRIHLDGARFGAFSNDPEYWVQSVEYLGKSHGKFEPRIRRSWRDMGAGDAGLLRGFAFEESWRHEEAVKALDAGIDAKELNKSRLALAHLTRGSALESIAYPPGRAINDRDDRLLVRAVSDYRQAAMLDPSDYRAVLWQGTVTRSLGAYEEAFALYETVKVGWPEQYFRVAILRGAAFRQVGDIDAALRELDVQVKEHGPQDGMMYHYHRGRTLIELQRYPEAVKELSAGLRTQPDYLWAFVARACAYAQQGDIDHALADQKRALESLQKVLKLESATSDAHRQRTTLELMLRELETASQSAPGRPNAAPCADVFSGPSEKRRERSQWFEPAGANAAVELP